MKYGTGPVKDDEDEAKSRSIAVLQILVAFGPGGGGTEIGCSQGCSTSQGARCLAFFFVWMEWAGKRNFLDRPCQHQLQRRGLLHCRRG